MALDTKCHELSPGDKGEGVWVMGYAQGRNKDELHAVLAENLKIIIFKY